MGGHKPRTLSGAFADWLRARIAAGPFTTRGLTAELVSRCIKTDRRSVWFFLNAERPSFKKTVLPAEQPRRDIAFNRNRCLRLTSRLGLLMLRFALVM